MRWGLGPVFFYECLANSRRWQTYAIRSAGVALLLAAIATIAMPSTTIDPRYAWREYAALGESYFYGVIGVELTLVMLAAPAATAGAICVDRARGTLAHMLATDLSDPEIVLGKLAARLLPVLGLVACSWPVLALSSLLGGIDPLALTLAFAIILAVALLGCSMALALSVWARKPHEVVLVVYTFWALVLLLWPIWYALAWRSSSARRPAGASLANPYYLAFAPYSAPGRVDFWDYLGFFAATLGAAVALAVLAVWRMRPVARRGTDEGRKGRRLGWVGRLARRLPGPALDGNPVLWREWHRSRPSRWTTILVVLVGGSTGVACAVGAVTALIARAGRAAGHRACGADRGSLRRDPAVDLRPADAFGRGADVDGRGAAAGQPRPPGRDHALHPDDRPGQVAGDAASSRAAGDRAGIAGTRPGPGREGPADDPAGTPGQVLRGIVRRGAALRCLPPDHDDPRPRRLDRERRPGARRLDRAPEPGDRPERGTRGDRGRRLADPRRGHAAGPAGEGLACLSPVVAVFELIEVVIERRRRGSDVLWWITFWDIECLALALGLLWLTVRTFDGRFDRVPDRPGRAPVLADVVMVLAGLIGIGSLIGGDRGLGPGDLGTSCPRSTLGVSACILAVAVGFVLLAALAASSMSPAATSPAMAPVSAAAISDRKSFAIRWWEAFRLVLLLAIGPALVALALATAPMAFRVATKVKPLPGGGSVRIETDPEGDTYVTTTDASGRADGPAGYRRGDRGGWAGPADPDPRRLAAGRRPGDRHGPGPRGGVRQPGCGAGGLDPAAVPGDRRERRPGPLRDGGLADRVSQHFRRSG